MVPLDEDLKKASGAEKEELKYIKTLAQTAVNDLQANYNRFYDAVREVQDTKMRRTKEEYEGYPYTKEREGKVRNLRTGLEKARSEAVTRMREVQQKTREAKKLRGQRRE